MFDRGFYGERDSVQENVVLDKATEFAVRIVKLYQYLSAQRREFILSKQLLRSGTSIGANINEAQAGYSKADFTAKMSIANKEARETAYWINLLIRTGYLNESDEHVKSLVSDIESIVRLLTSIVKTSQI